jgi:hypothetical protein
MAVRFGEDEVRSAYLMKMIKRRNSILPEWAALDEIIVKIRIKFEVSTKREDR